MTLQAYRRKRLEFESVASGPNEIRWAVSRERQPVGKEWCWAASLVNVLAAYGREVEQHVVVRDFRATYSEVEPDDGRNLAREHWLPFYRQWFDQAEMCTRPDTEQGLKEVLATAPLVAVLDNESGDHLMLVSGLRRNGGAWDVEISDSLWETRHWIPWNELISGQGPRSSEAYWGPWNRAIYLGPPRFREYVRRFVQSVADLDLGVLEEKGSWIPTDRHPSSLHFETPPKIFRLAEELSLSLLAYLLRYEEEPGSQLETYLHESIPLRAWRPSGTRHLSLLERFPRYGWHHQLFSESGGPRPYAQTLRVRDDWRTRWIGRSWLTEKVDHAIRWLDRAEGAGAGAVELLWLDLGRHRHVHLFHLVESRRFLAVSATEGVDRKIWRTEEGFQVLEEREVSERLGRSVQTGFPDIWDPTVM